MARRKKTKTEVEAIVQPDQGLQDLTDVGMDVEGLQEVEVTEVEAAIEAGEDKELIEEKDEEEECKTEKNSESQNEEKDSKKESEKQNNDLQESAREVSKKNLQPSVEEKTPKQEPSVNASSESVRAERSVRPSAPQRNRSKVGTKKSQRNYQPVEVVLPQDEIPSHPKKERTVKPVQQDRKKAGIRSSVGVFYRP
jgi:hypothetical protein